MMRGTFGNIRLRNALVPGREGPYTVHLPDGEEQFIYDAAMRYRDEAVPLVILAGKEYGSGSSRDWAAKGTLLLGVRAVIAESFERIHRSNLVGMGVLPLEFLPGESGRPERWGRRRTLVRGSGPPRWTDRRRLLPPWWHPARRPPRSYGQSLTAKARFVRRPLQFGDWSIARERTGAPQDRLEHRRAEPAGERVPLARMERADLPV